jgi:hypothetical protein
MSLVQLVNKLAQDPTKRIIKVHWADGNSWLAIVTIARAAHSTTSWVTFEGPTDSKNPADNDEIVFDLMQGNESPEGFKSVDDNGGITTLTSTQYLKSTLTSRSSKSGKEYKMNAFGIRVGFEWFVDQEEAQTWVYFRLNKPWTRGKFNFTITTITDDPLNNQIDVFFISIPAANNTKVDHIPSQGFGHDTENPGTVNFGPGAQIGKVINYFYSDNQGIFPGPNHGSRVDYPMILDAKLKFDFSRLD